LHMHQYIVSIDVRMSRYVTRDKYPHENLSRICYDYDILMRSIE